MAAYYNEIDPFAAQWLRELIAAGLIATGEVDERSIKDVKANDLKDFTQCHFFAGIGGWSYALRLAGWGDDRPVWTGSCPCQPFSLAGSRQGFDDSRHLWPEFARLIRDAAPSVVFGEQVASASDWLGIVRGELGAMGYAVGTVPIEAASAGSDHLRDRFWFVGVTEGVRGGARFRQSNTQQDGCRTAETGNRSVSVADAYIPVTSEGREQRGRKQRGAGRNPQARRGGNLAHGNGNGELGQSREEGAAPGEGEAKVGHEDGERLRVFDFGTRDSLGLSDAHGGRQQECEEQHGDTAQNSSDWNPCGRHADRHSDEDFNWVIGADGKTRRVKSGIRLLVNGFPARVGLLRGFGNAIDPRPAATFIQAAIEVI